MTEKFTDKLLISVLIKKSEMKYKVYYSINTTINMWLTKYYKICIDYDQQFAILPCHPSSTVSAVKIEILKRYDTTLTIKIIIFLVNVYPKQTVLPKKDQTWPNQVIM